MSKNYRDELVGVFGYPVDDNPTVVIQEAAFRALGLPYRYLTIEVRPGDLGHAMDGLRAMNMKGINITMPFKTEVLQYLDEVAPDAAVMGAVNTVYVKDGKLYGENTDGKGFLLALKQGGVELSGKKAVLLGAGGAARAIAVELANAGVKEIVVVNRGTERGEALAALINEKTSAHAEYVKWNGTYPIPADADILVNCTSIGFEPGGQEKPDVDYGAINETMTVCDVIPNTPDTPFLKEAGRRGARIFDGLTMLINQGVLGFELWTGQKAPVDAMRLALEEEFGLI